MRSDMQKIEKISEEVLVIVYSIEAYFYSNIASRYNFFSVYRKLNQFEKKLLSIRGQWFFFTPLFLGEYKEKLEQIKTVIVFDSAYNYFLMRFIKKVNPRCKIILYMNNLITFEHQKKMITDKHVDEVWSFDKGDALRYGLAYNKYFYYYAQPFDCDIKYDIIFIGRDKGRADTINKLIATFDNLGIVGSYYIIRNDNDCLSYYECVRLLNEARCILEVTVEGQVGFTMRVMEALFYKKKLITTNTTLVEYDFYNPNNIFIYGLDDINLLKNFIESDYQDLPDNILKSYTVGEWLKRFFQ